MIETAEQAERYLASLDPVGWRFGLERIQLLLAELGDPQTRFRSVHVVGTNGKSSVAELGASILLRAGSTAGAYLSPHVSRWSERIRIGGAEIAGPEFAAAVDLTARAAIRVDGRLEAPDRLTQFEVATAAAFVALADAGVEWAVVEAGLGGRLDATNVLDSTVTALPSISLEHTELLGDTEEAIAAEKLAVLRPGSALVVGGLAPAVDALARSMAAERSAQFILADPDSVPPPRSGGNFSRTNLAVAAAAAELALGRGLGAEVERVAEEVTLTGRAEVRAGVPPTIVDAAHNPGGAAALAEVVTEIAAGRPVVGCIAMLEGKDVPEFAKALAPAVGMAICTSVPAERLTGVGRPGASSIDPELLVREFAAAGVPARSSSDPASAIALARQIAAGAGGVALVTGTHYLLRYVDEEL